MSLFLYKLYCDLKKNWKTTLCGVIILVSLGAMWYGKITAIDFMGIVGLVASFGFFASRDGIKHPAPKSPANEGEGQP